MVDIPKCTDKRMLRSDKRVDVLGWFGRVESMEDSVLVVTQWVGR